METIAVARNAMATRFEILLHGENATSLRAAGEEALNEIDRLEAQLSLYRPGSEIAQVNARAAREAVRVSPPVFRLLQQAQELHRETGGFFDISIAPLVRCWGFMGATGRMPEPQAVEDARAVVGMNLVELDSQNSSVRFARPGVMLDLGAIGKGYAIDQAAEMLRDSGVSSALLHGGTSTIYGLGVPPDGDFWKIALEYPKLAGAGTERKLAAAVPLRDESLSVSAVWGRSFEAGGKSFGHVLDPRNGQPVAGAMLAAVALPAALETDALSTALLVAGEAGHGQIASLRPKMRTLVISQESGAAGNYRLFGQGILKER